MMDGAAFSSYKHQADQELLDRLGSAILSLKLETQGQLGAYGISTDDARGQHDELVRFLDALEQRVRLLQGESVDGEVDLAYTGLADRFINASQDDLPGQFAELERVCGRLRRSGGLEERDFRFLDALHALLQEEAAEGVRGLYRL